MLRIIRHEGKKFLKRWKVLRKLASRIHHQMKEENRDGQTPEIGAIQGPDVIREELLRTVSLLEAGKQAHAVSRNMQRLESWASECRRERRRKKGEASSSPDVPTPTSEPRIPSKKTSRSTPLTYARVSPSKSQDGAKANEDSLQDKSEESPFDGTSAPAAEESVIPAVRPRRDPSFVSARQRITASKHHA